MKSLLVIGLFCRAECIFPKVSRCIDEEHSLFSLPYFLSHMFLPPSIGASLESRKRKKREEKTFQPTFGQKTKLNIHMNNLFNSTKSIMTMHYIIISRQKTSKNCLFRLERRLIKSCKIGQILFLFRDADTKKLGNQTPY